MSIPSYITTNKLKNILPNTTDKIKSEKLTNDQDKTKNENQSDIYEIICDKRDRKYIGQTRRNIKTRFNEHFSLIKFDREEKFAVAEH